VQACAREEGAARYVVVAIQIQVDFLLFVDVFNYDFYLNKFFCFSYALTLSQRMRKHQQRQLSTTIARQRLRKALA
jgi:hypothetical protein